MGDWELLQAYATQRSETAFAELVQRHVHWVYSAALRQVNDRPLADDVTQAVFVLLARKAGTLRSGTILTGWLFRTTRFVVKTALRAQRRRQRREEVASAMMSTADSPAAAETVWNQLAPHLDEAVAALSESDRSAILLRFYEQKSLREVGERLGLSEDAAKKRVTRALDKLRAFLTRRGVALGAVGLAGILTEQTVQAAPATLATGALHGALAGTSVLPDLVRETLNAWRLAKLKLVAGIAAVTVTGIVLTTNVILKREQSAQPSSSVAAAPRAANDVATSQPSAGLQQPVDKPVEESTFHLTLLAADTGAPVSRGSIECWRWEGGSTYRRTMLASDAAGDCTVSVPPKTTKLQLTTRIEGFTDTRLSWDINHGEVIPETYTVRLVRPVRIGGRVVGPDDEPVAGASVGFNHKDDPALATRPESHEFDWIEVQTDADGRWQINRIAPELLRWIYGSAKHPEYVGSSLSHASQDPELEKRLREGTAVFHLKGAVIVKGSVVDAGGQPVPNARVFVGVVGMGGGRETNSLSDGAFEVHGCQPGKSLLTAEAEGFAATTIETELAVDSPPFLITLKSGKPLRLRVVDTQGRGIGKARVWLDTMRNTRPTQAVPLQSLPLTLAPTQITAASRTPPPVVQADFQTNADTEGRILWENAPDSDLVFGVGAPGFIRTHDVTVHPDGQEHQITLQPALVIYGTVRDATSGEKIPKFRIEAGWPEHNPIDHSETPRWSTIGRFTVSYQGGEFRHVMEETVLMGDPNFLFKFEADGYAPFVTRPVHALEREVQFDVSLRRAQQTRILVTLPDGNPAVGADVCFVEKGTQLIVMPGRLSGNQAKIIRTDEQGSFALPDYESVIRVIMAHPSGFIETTPVALATSPKVQLEAWGRIEGSCLSGGEPAAGRTLSIDYGQPQVNPSHVFIRAEINATVDATGQFVFPQVPPGKRKVARWVPSPPPPGTRQLMALADADVVPGETITLTIGQGYKVSVRLRWADDLKSRTNTQVLVFMRSGLPDVLSEIAANTAELEQWRQTPEVQEALKNARGYTLNEEADGIWVVEAAEAGRTYTLEALAFDRNATSRPPTPIGAARTTITIPSEPAEGKIDAGEIVLQRPE